jgi:hypothetical protein
MKPTLPTGNGKHIRRTLGPSVIALLAFLVPATAHAITVSGTGSPTNLQAGSHSNFNIHIDLGPNSEDVKDLTVGLPPGEVGDPTATPKCTVEQLNSSTAGSDGCDPATQVGTVVANVTITVVVVPVTLDVSGKLYNLTPQPGEPARFGIVLQPGDLGGALTLPLPPVILQSGASLRQTDYGLNTVINNIPNMTQGLPTHINSQTITLFGIAPGTGKPFMRNPTSCTPHVVDFAAVPHPPASGTATGSAPAFTPTGCSALDFSPSFSAKVGGGKPPEQVPISTAIDQDVDEAGLRIAHVQTPADLGANLTQLNNFCAVASFQAGTCPPQDIVGSAVATSPLLTQPLTGPVLLVQSVAIPNIGLDLNGQLHFLLQGTLGLDNAVEFSGLPDIPISHFELKFNGPPNGLLVANRNLCLPPPPLFGETFTGYNGAVTSLATPATVEGTCGAEMPKCKKAKKKRKKHSAETAKKKHKKKSCKKKKKKKR